MKNAKRACEITKKTKHTAPFVLLLLLSLAGIANATPVSPFLSLYEDTLCISFYTADPGRYTLSLLPEGQPGWQTFLEPEATSTHTFALTDWEPDKEIAFRLTHLAESTTGRFHTPRASFPVRALLYGDSRWGQAVHQSILNHSQELEFDFFVNLGDVVNTPDDQSEWAIFTESVRTVSGERPYQLVLGNHDWKIPDAEKTVPGYPTKGYYAFVLGRTRWIVLNTNERFSDWLAAGETDQGRFLLSELQKTRTNQEIPILITHHPVFSAGPHGEESVVKRLRAFLLPYIREFRIPLVISGHDHAYQKIIVDDTLYLITAGGGAALYSQTYEPDGLVCYYPVHHCVLLSVEEQGIQGIAYDTDRAVIDAFYFPHASLNPSSPAP